MYNDAGVKEYEYYHREQIQPEGHFAASSRKISMPEMKHFCSMCYKNVKMTWL
jgi:hypothetical protein